MKPHFTTGVECAQGMFCQESLRAAWLSALYRIGVVFCLAVLLASGLVTRAQVADGQGEPTMGSVIENQHSVAVSISASTDDAEEQGVNGADPGAIYLDSTDLEIVEDQETPSFGNQTIGLRFNGIAVPQGVTISDAYLTFSAVAADPPNRNDGATNISIAGQAASNAGTFMSARNDISSRPRTSATVSWTPSPWAADTTYNTPSLTVLVQEIVKRADWASGNSMAFLITGSGSRSAVAYDGDLSRAPLLHIAWTSTPRKLAYLPFVQKIMGDESRLLNGDFEAGQGIGWQEYSAQGLPIVVQGYGALAVAVHGGAWGAWLAGTNNELSWIEQRTPIPAVHPVLSYWHYILSDDTCGHDRVRILIDGAEVDRYDLCQSTSTAGWVQHQVDLSGYAGSTVQLQLRGETNGSEISHVLVDDVTLLSQVTTGER